MDLALALAEFASGPRPASWRLFQDTLGVDWIEQSLRSTGAASVRRRRLPADYVVWLVIGMALFADRSIEAVVRHLGLALPSLRQTPVSSSAVVQARDRLGIAPLVDLFTRTAAHWTQASATALRWRGLTVYGIDGTTLRVPDSVSNAAFFGRPTNGHGQAGYPQLRLVALSVLRSHLLAAVSLGPYTLGEHSIAAPLWKQLPCSSVTIIDKGFLSYWIFHCITSFATERHWLTRARSRLNWTLVRHLGPGDDLIELSASSTLLKAHAQCPPTMRARAIHYQRSGFRPQVLLTSLLDDLAYPASEVVRLYHERWEIELAFDETKTHTLERHETLRSQHPERVCQEVWGLAIAYNLVRLEMARAAHTVALPPTRISYRNSLLLIRNFCITAWLSSPATIPRQLQRLRQELALLVIPERRPRAYPRVVKFRATPYPRKPR